MLKENEIIKRIRVYSDNINLFGNHHHLLFVDGIGDFFVLESWMSECMRSSVKEMWWATRVQYFISELVNLLPNFTNLTKHNFLWEDWDSVFCWHHKFQVANFLKNNKIPWGNITEYVWKNAYPKIRANQHRYPIRVGSFIEHDLKQDIGRFQLPSNYHVICPYSSYNRKFNAHLHKFQRDFNKTEWDSVTRYLKRRSQIGVVLNIGNDWIPDDSSLINLNNKTNLAESIEIMKRAKGYIGVDSCMSVLAARMFNPPNLFIKTVHSHCLNWKDVYFYPHRSFGFLVNTLNYLK